MSQLITLNNGLYARLPFLANLVTPSPLKSAELVALSPTCMQLLGLDEDSLKTEQWRQLLAGVPVDEHQYFAQVYAGHQFGHFVPQLGDGRAMSIGELTNAGSRYELQLKGAGLTPYSRMGDGRAVLRSSIREFLASEAMAGLNIPTTRALSLVTSEEPVYRESIETGAIVARVSESFIRFGHFEYWFHQNKKDELNELATYCIEQLFPECQDTDNPKLALLEAVVDNTARLIAKWQAQGFAHGVMNTDNMSILGLTIDYGPFAFLDDYIPSFICNHSDSSGRYAFDQQPSIGLWNLNAFALTFSHWLSTEEITKALKRYEPTLVEHYLALMKNKLGFCQWGDAEHQLMAQWLDLLAKESADYTLAFRNLQLVDVNDEDNKHCQPLLMLFSDQALIVKWLDEYKSLLKQQPQTSTERIARQNQHNAKFVLRNYLAQQAIELAEQGDFTMVNDLMTVLSTPYEEHSEFEQFSQAAPDWGKELCISCSS